MNIKLEDRHGATVHVAEVALEVDPPEAMLWNGRVFRLLRTDGIWEHKKHVYREATLHDLGSAPAVEEAPHIGETSPATAAKSSDGKKADRQISVNLTIAQAALLKRVRVSGAHASNKAAVIAGLEALEKESTMSNDALLALLAKRLTDHARSR